MVEQWSPKPKVAGSIPASPAIFLKRVMNDIVLYIKESYNELIHKVTWPTWPNLFSNTRLVIIASVILALVIFLMDVVSKGVLTRIYNL